MKKKSPEVFVPKWKRELDDNERQRALGLTTARMYRISCPYCLVGAATVTVETKAGQLQFPLTDPVKCGSCLRHFQLRVKVKLYGEKINGS